MKRKTSTRSVSMGYLTVAVNEKAVTETCQKIVWPWALGQWISGTGRKRRLCGNGAVIGRQYEGRHCQLKQPNLLTETKSGAQWRSLLGPFFFAIGRRT